MLFKPSFRSLTCVPAARAMAATASLQSSWDRGTSSLPPDVLTRLTRSSMARPTIPTRSLASRCAAATLNPLDDWRTEETRSSAALTVTVEERQALAGEAGEVDRHSAASVDAGDAGDEEGGSSAVAGDTRVVVDGECVHDQGWFTDCTESSDENDVSHLVPPAARQEGSETSGTAGPSGTSGAPGPEGCADGVEIEGCGSGTPPSRRSPPLCDEGSCGWRGRGLASLSAPASTGTPDFPVLIRGNGMNAGCEVHNGARWARGVVPACAIRCQQA